MRKKCVYFILLLSLFCLFLLTKGFYLSQHKSDVIFDGESKNWSAQLVQEEVAAEHYNYSQVLTVKYKGENIVGDEFVYLELRKSMGREGDKMYMNTTLNENKEIVTTLYRYSGLTEKDMLLVTIIWEGDEESFTLKAPRKE